MKSHRKQLALLLSLAFAGSSAMAAGVGAMTIRTNNDTFTNPGQIKSTSEASGGVSTSVAAQRVIAPVLVVYFDYQSSGNRYTNSGLIDAKSKASGGVSTAVAGQDVVH